LHSNTPRDHATKLQHTTHDLNSNHRDRGTAAVAAAGTGSFAAGLRGLLGGASSRLFGSLLGASLGGARSGEGAEGEDEEASRDLWFTQLEDFKPLCHMLHRGHVMTAWFAQANRTGHHFVLKKFDKSELMLV